MADELPRILAVDDDQEILDVLGEIFKEDLFQLAMATDGAAALVKALNEKFDVIISDIRMPNMDGLELVRKLRQANLNIPILLISASLDEYAREIALLGNVNVIAKPFKATELLRIVNTAIAESRTGSAETATGSAVDEIRCKEGDMFIDESSPSRDIFLVKEGRFRLTVKSKNGQVTDIGIVGPGEMLGEISALLNTNPSASAVATSAGVLVRIPADKITLLMKDQPQWFKILLQTHCTRLKDVTTKLAE